MKLLAGSSNLPFAQSLAHQMELPLIDVEISHFPNGEKRVWVKDEVKGENVTIIQSFAEPTDQHIMEFLLLADALERLGARHVNLVLPWMGYSLQDKAFRAGEPIAAKVIANLVSNSYIKRVFLLDLHNSSTPGFFSIPTQHLSALTLFADYAQRNFDLNNFIVASPDFGGLKRARLFADRLGIPYINIDKHRDLSTGEPTAISLSGDVEGKSILIFDDVINAGGTITTTSAILKKHGAQQVHFFATHGPLVKAAFTKIDNSEADSVVVTNSIHHDQTSAKVRTLDAAPIFAEELKTWWKAR
ncbi:MAG TPA: ribose-phosphate pyrophosphokinase [Vitreimonas sp.]|nr:ribose-phosphate pyrophosphokinase [Vitreimonas sp.]